jgi:hypothetical protein
MPGNAAARAGGRRRAEHVRSALARGAVTRAIQQFVAANNALKPSAMWSCRSRVSRVPGAGAWFGRVLAERGAVPGVRVSGRVPAAVAGSSAAAQLECGAWPRDCSGSRRCPGCVITL